MLKVGDVLYLIGSSYITCVISTNSEYTKQAVLDCLYMPETLIGSVWLSQTCWFNPKEYEIIGNVFENIHTHTPAIYDSGWSRYTYCSMCDAKLNDIA